MDAVTWFPASEKIGSSGTNTRLIRLKLNDFIKSDLEGRIDIKESYICGSCLEVARSVVDGKTMDAVFADAENCKSTHLNLCSHNKHRNTYYQPSMYLSVLVEDVVEKINTNAFKVSSLMKLITAIGSAPRPCLHDQVSVRRPTVEDLSSSKCEYSLPQTTGNAVMQNIKSVTSFE